MSRKILEEIALSGPESLFETQHAHPRVWKVLRNHISSHEKAWLRECSDTRQVGVKCL